MAFSKFIIVYEAINHELWRLYGLKSIAKEELRYQRFHKTFQFFNYENMILAKLWADEYLTISPYKTHLVEGTMDVLSYLKDKYELHLITNGFKEVQYIKLEQCQLKPFFNHILISEEQGFNKPDIRIFKLAERLVNARVEECVMIGDNFEVDVEGALNANWKAIHLSEIIKEQSHVNYRQIQKLIQLKELL